MLEQVMRERSCSLKVKLTVKGLVSFGLIVLAVLLPQLVHRVHQALEHPEVHQRVQSPVSATGQPYPAVMYTRTWLSVSGTSERTARSESQSETAK